MLAQILPTAMLVTRPGGGAERLRLLSFNVLRPEWGSPDYPAWEHRREAAMAVLAEVMPDLIGLQEESQTQLDDLLGSDAGLQLAGERPHIGGSIVYRRTKFHLDQFGRLAVPERIAAIGNRTVQWALLRLAASGARILLVNGHLTPFEEAARLQGVERILDFLAGFASPHDHVLILGDLNIWDNDPPLRCLLANQQLRLRSAWRWVHGFRDPATTARLVAAARAGVQVREDALKAGMELSADAATAIEKAIAAAGQGSCHCYQARPFPGQIDHILVPDGITIVSSAIITTPHGSILPSDHYPLWAEIELPAR